MKKRIIFLVLVCLLLLPSYVLATENVEMIGVTENPGYLEDNLIKPSSFNYPEKTYNIAQKGAYYFSGVTHQNPLFTNYLLFGKTHYNVEAKSTHDGYDLNIVAYKKRKGFDKNLGSLKTSSSGSFDFYVDSSSDEVYLKFYAPTACDGKIY